MQFLSFRFSLMSSPGPVDRALVRLCPWLSLGLISTVMLALGARAGQLDLLFLPLHRRPRCRLMKFLPECSQALTPVEPWLLAGSTGAENNKGSPCFAGAVSRVRGQAGKILAAAARRCFPKAAAQRLAAGLTKRLETVLATGAGLSTVVRHHPDEVITDGCFSGVLRPIPLWPGVAV